MISAILAPLNLGEEPTMARAKRLFIIIWSIASAMLGGQNFAPDDEDGAQGGGKKLEAIVPGVQL
jgi:hypothetical protein